MSVVENIISMVVLMGLLLAAFVIITGLNVNFFSDVVDTSVKEYNTEKYQNDLDAILNTTEPVSGSNYAGLLADAVYYRRKYFDYNAPRGLEINEDIGSYYNQRPEDIAFDLDKNVLQVNELMKLTFEELYGKENFYLEISPLILKLRLYFIVDGSPSLENEIEGLKEAIPALIESFESEFDVVARVFVLASGGLDKLDPCAELQEYAECKYLHREEMYSNQTPNGWLRARRADLSGNLGSRLSGSPFNINAAEPEFSTDNWTLTMDEFLDETGIARRAGAYYCTWVELEKASLDDFKIALAFSDCSDSVPPPEAQWLDSAGIKVNSQWYTAENGKPVSIYDDLDETSNWQLICIGNRTSCVEGAQISYNYVMTKAGSDINGYFNLNETFGFRLRPEEYMFSEDVMDMNVDYNRGIFYEDWATASVYATLVAEKENPSTLTVIIPISDELSLGSEADECETDFEEGAFYKKFCEICNKRSEAAVVALQCPLERSDGVVDRAIRVIKPYGYNVFPVLATSCDVADPFTYRQNIMCNNFDPLPYAGCTEDNPYCGQCFGPDEMQCPGLTLENPELGVHASNGCDKKQCRDAIAEDMERIAKETGGEMIELAAISSLYEEISEAIQETIDEGKITAGVKKEEKERFVFKKLVPLSNRLFADFKFWHYKHAAGEE